MCQTANITFYQIQCDNVGYDILCDIVMIMLCVCYHDIIVEIICIICLRIFRTKMSFFEFLMTE